MHTTAIAMTWFLAVSVVVVAGEAGSPPEARAAVDRWVEDNLPDLLEFYRERHRHPELSLEERESGAAVAERLRAAGFTVTTGVGGHGVVGVLANGAGPTVLIRGDMDALPIVEETGLPHRSEVTAIRPDGTTVGVMHACGHDIHMSHLVGTAAALAAAREHWSGTLVAVGQPAEEIGRGAAAMIADGLFERFPSPDACLALHVDPGLPAGVVAYTPGWATANVDSVDITIYGRGGHGSRPHEAVDPVVTAAQVVMALQTVVSRRADPVEPAVITVGSIHAGSTHNVIPSEARLQLTVRSFAESTRNTLLDGIRQVTVNTCRAMGCPREPDVVVQEASFTPSGYNDPELAALAAGLMADILGADSVRTIPPLTVGEDFARYAQDLGVPGFMYWLGTIERERWEAAQASGEPLPPLHSSRFAPDPGPTIATAIRCTSAIALELLARRGER